MSSEAASSTIGLAAGVSNLFLFLLFLFLLILFLLPTILIFLPDHCTSEVLDLLPDENKFLYNFSLHKSRMIKSSMIQLKNKTRATGESYRSILSSSLALSSLLSPLRLDDIFFVLQSLPQTNSLPRQAALLIKVLTIVLIIVLIIVQLLWLSLSSLSLCSYGSCLTLCSPAGRGVDARRGQASYPPLSSPETSQFGAVVDIY